MASHLGNYFHDHRIQMGLSLGQLARLVGYGNISKGSNKICRFERDGIITEEILARLADALDIDLQTVEALIDQDCLEHLRAWEEWVSKPVPMCLIVRYLAAVYGKVKLPEEITTHEQAEAFASKYAKDHRHSVCLALSRKHSIWINAQGQVYSRTEATPDDPNVPFMRLKGCNRTSANARTVELPGI
jgi:transcriptional regulator with XRE-family HTH domain